MMTNFMKGFLQGPKKWASSCKILLNEMINFIYAITEAKDRLKYIQILWMEKCKWEVISLAKAKKD